MPIPVCSVHVLHLVLVVGISLLTSEEVFTVLVKSQVGHLNVGGMDGDLGLLSVHLLLDEFLNVNAPFAAVNFSDLTLTVLQRPANDLHSVAITNGD